MLATRRTGLAHQHTRDKLRPATAAARASTREMRTPERASVRGRAASRERKRARADGIARARAGLAGIGVATSACEAQGSGWGARQRVGRRVVRVAVRTAGVGYARGGCGGRL
jgi:hypothetical protein